MTQTPPTTGHASFKRPADFLVNVTEEDPTLNWTNIRVTSSSSIQTVVSTCLVHLANPSNSNPIILHTLPSSSTKLVVVPKNSHAGLCKLISIVEIVKRELEPHQKELWRREDEKEAKKLRRKEMSSSSRKGKKRAREEEHDDDDADMSVSQELVASAPVSLEEAGSSTTTSAAAGQARTTIAAGSSSTKQQSITSMNKKRKSRPLLRVYQYNILDCFERLGTGGSSMSRELDEEYVDGEHGSSSSSSSSDEEDADSEEEDEVNAKSKSTTQAALDSHRGAELLAAAQLDNVIRNHVIKAKKRPRKKHTPYMQIILSTTRLPAFESYYGASRAGKSSKDNDHVDDDKSDEAKRRIRGYTLQLPQKKARSRTKKKRRRLRDPDQAPGDLELTEAGQPAVFSSDDKNAVPRPEDGVLPTSADDGAHDMQAEEETTVAAEQSTMETSASAAREPDPVVS